MTEKFISYFRLLGACETAGCPVCRCVIDDGRRHLQALLYEQVNDPETRRRLRSSYGLCNWHMWMMQSIGTNVTGVAILQEDLLGVVTRQAAQLRPRHRGLLRRSLAWLHDAAGGVRRLRERKIVGTYAARSSCPVCDSGRDAEDRYSDAIADFIQDAQFLRAYANSSGLCVPHLMRIVALRADTAALSRLEHETVTKWEKVRRDLESFVRKHEYRNIEPISEAEAAAVTRAMEVLAGGPGVFGNDLHHETPQITEGAG